MHTLILGFDAFDPKIFESLLERGLMPNLRRFVEARGYSPFEVANPPQSEVSWTSIATGLNPGAHGMFDFVHRDAQRYIPYVSLLPTQEKLGMTRFVRPFKAATIFDMAAKKGYPATSLWWPGTFPAKPESPVRTLPGLGTPDLLGRLGVGCLYSSDPELPEKLGKTPVMQLLHEGQRRYRQSLIGPTQKKRSSEETLTIPLVLEGRDERTAILALGQQLISLTLGEWSPILELKFRVNRFLSIRAVTQVILTQLEPTVRLYFLPLQLHPLGSIWPYGSPKTFVERTWEACGPFLTLGWPQDTTGLEDGCIDDDQFRALCTSIEASRARVLLHHLDDFHEGVLAAVFDTLDRVQHMYWRDRPDIVETWYMQLDSLLDRITTRFAGGIGSEQRLVILSDHGVDRVDHAVHLNRWLIDRGYLRSSEPSGDGQWKSIDWSNSQAYAIGLNSLYLNMEGREGQGIVRGDQRDELSRQIKRELLEWTGPDGRPVVQRAWLNHEAFSGPLAEHGPELIVGYSVGYRASSETGLGGWSESAVQPNADHWGADHCFDVEEVPGVLFVNRPLADSMRPSYRDIPELTIDAEPDSSQSGPPPSIGDEDSELIEERLRSLGYL